VGLQGSAPREPRWPSTYGFVLVGVVALQPFAAFAYTNQAQLTHRWRVAGYAGLTLVAAEATLAVVVRRWRRSDPDRAALVVAILVASFFRYSVLVAPDDPYAWGSVATTLVLWLLLTVLVARLVYLIGTNESVRLALLIFAAVLLLLPTASYVTAGTSDEALPPVRDPGPLAIPAERPNVYWLMLDGHARPDVLERVLGYDDQPFVTALEDHGFQVSSSSRTSYPRTHLSLSSTLEMRYVLEPGHHVTDDFARFSPVVLGHNRTVARFEALGYQTIYGSAGGIEWSACRDDLVDVCLPYHQPFPPTGELEKSLLELTPLGVIPLPVPYADPLTFAEGLVDPSLGVEEPFFAFQHIMSPHEPYRYRPDCSPRSRPIDVLRAAPQDRWGLYRTQVRCIDRLVTQAVDDVVQRDPTAIIVVQSDHGSDFVFRWDDPDALTPAQLTERYGVFNAMRLPERCGADIEGQPLVNTFAIVFGCIEGTTPQLLDYRAFAQPFDDVGALVELTPDRFGPRP